MGYVVRRAAPCAEFWIGPTVAGGGGVSSHERWLECPLFFAVAGPCNMSEWGDRHEEESHDKEGASISVGFVYCVCVSCTCQEVDGF